MPSVLKDRAISAVKVSGTDFAEVCAPAPQFFRDGEVKGFEEAGDGLAD
jgi:hypothetical protein